MDNKVITMIFWLLILIGLWLANKFLKIRKRKSMKEKEIPEEFLNIFNEAEEKLKGGIKEDGTTTSPYKILWEIGREQGRKSIRERTNRELIKPEQPTNDRELYEQSRQQQNIQTRIITNTNKDEPVIRELRQNNFRRIISRIRRKGNRGEN